ncbi:MAG: LytTR family DNA-binding domain-containing protein [Terriglobales bacterium]
MRTVIADDEPLALKKLRLLLSAEPGIQIVAECADGAQTVKALESYRPDLLMLDIHMPDLDGFEVLGRIPAEEMPVVIFTTAYDRYAVRAFEAHALDYLLKPFDQDRLHQAINRARAELLKTEDRETTHRILHYLAEGATKESHGDNRFVIKAGGRVVFLDFDEIDWLEAAANYVRLNVGKQSYLLREGIGHVAERLDPAQFIRIHRSTIVNVDKIKELQPVNSGEYIVVLKDGKELSCSRGYRAGLQRLIETNL